MFDSLVIFAQVTTTGTAQVSTLLSGIETFLVNTLMVLGPVVFLVGLVAHGLGSTHNSQNGAQWGSRAMRAGAGIFIGAIAVTVLFQVLKGLL
jgi:hypothetical protein